MTGATADPSREAAPETLGPYRIRATLGRGGMGVVYRAEHARTGAQVAIKTVSSLDPTRLAALRGEIQTLLDVRHPGLASLVDHGHERGLPWYAMELLEGRTLRHWLRELHPERSEVEHLHAGESATVSVAVSAAVSATVSATVSASVGAAAPLHPAPAPAHVRPFVAAHLAPLARLAETLAFLHARGIVHRDLKPENVFLRDDRSPVLVDLGIAARFAAADGREPLQRVDAAGSAAYMAPEQIRGELADPRSDLYGLGCLIHECVVGVPPFTGDAGDVLRAHLDEAPVALSRRVPDVPPELDRLVGRLLAKRAEDRPTYAIDVARALDRLTLASVDRSAVEPIERAEPLPRPALVGRSTELARLTDAVERAARGEPGSVVFLAGESGIGKTRLAMEVARVAAARGLAVIAGACGAPGAATSKATARPLEPFAPVLLAIADRCRAGGPAQTARLLGESSSVLARYEPALAELVPSSPSPPGDARARVVDALATSVGALARETPLLLVLDDLQWADALSLEALRRLTELRAPSLFVLGTFRSDEAEPMLEAIASTGMRIPLGRLSSEDVDVLVAGLLAWPTPAPELLAFLRRRGGGNPFFAAECVRAAIDDRVLERDAAGRWRLSGSSTRRGELDRTRPLPRTVSALIVRRLQRVGGPAREVARAAAVLGRELDLALLAEVVGRDVAGEVALLEQRQIVEHAGAGRVRFVHDRIREVAYARAPRRLREKLHARAAAALEARLGHAAHPAALAALGHHHEAAGACGRAAEHLLRAADGARSLYANEDAARLYAVAARAARRARAEDGEERWLALEARVQEALGDVEALGGAHARARKAYARALECEADAVVRARVHRKLGRTWETQHRHARALAAYERAEATLGEPRGAPARAEWIELQIDRIAVHYWRAEVDRIADLAQRLRPVVEAHGERAQRDRFFRTVIQHRLRAERYAATAETVGYARAYVAACERASDEPDVASARCGLGTVLLWHGDLDGAERALQSALESAERIGDVALRARCLCYLAFAQRRRRAVEPTRALALRAVAAAEDAGMADYAGAARGNLAWVAWSEGAYVDAARLGRDALSLWRGVVLVFPFEWLARLPLIGAGVSELNMREISSHVRALLAPSQAKLPAELVGALEGVLQARGTERSDRVRHAIGLARRFAYL